MTKIQRLLNELEEAYHYGHEGKIQEARMRVIKYVLHLERERGGLKHA